MTGFDKLYHDHDDAQPALLRKAQPALLRRVPSAEIPTRSRGTIGDTVWNLLEGCWSRDPGGRPALVELYNALSDPSSHHRTTDIPEGRVTERLPLKQYLHPVVIDFRAGGSPPGPRRFYLKFKYGEMNHTTDPRSLMWWKGSWRYVWYAYAHFCAVPYR